MENAWISRMVEGGIGDPTISINATEDAANKIIAADDPLAAFLQEMNLGAIAVQMHHPCSAANGGRFTPFRSFFHGIRWPSLH
jgi:hypothetical protein